MRTDSSCNAGYYLQERKKLPNGTVIPVVVRVFTGDGKPAAGAKVSLDITNDGKPAVLKRRTNKHGLATIPIKFLDKSRADMTCSLATLTITKDEHVSAQITVHNPNGSCGSCV